MQRTKNNNDGSDDGRSLRAVDPLVAYDEAKAAECSADVDLTAGARPSEELADELACVDLMHRVWPDGGHRPLSTNDSSAKTLGDFRFIREIGRGGMGIVYEAEQISMGRRVALKVLSFAALVDDKSLHRFRNEVRAAAALDHPHIVPIYSMGEDRGVHYYAMQLVRGQSLAQMIGERRKVSRATPHADNARSEPASASDSPINPNESTERDEQHQIGTVAETRRDAEYYRATARLGIQAAEAIQHAHDQGVLHRDIKPANLLLDRDGKLYVTDFGLARIVADAGLTMTGDIVGTLRYMPPEQALGKRVVIDHRADIYSLGTTIYELLALQPAFDESDRQELIRSIAFEEPRPLRKVDRYIPAELETIVAKAISKQPEERYETAQHLANDLRAFLEHRPINAKAPTMVGRVMKWSRRHNQLVTVTAAGLMLVTGILAASVTLVNRARTTVISALDETSAALYMSDMARAFEAWENGWGDEVQEILGRQIPAVGKRDQRGFEWHLLHSFVKQPEPVAELAGHKGPVREIAVLPKHGWLASAGEDGTLRLWDTTTGALLKTIELCSEPLHAVAVSPDERYVVAGSNAVYLCDLNNEFAVDELLRSDRPLESLAFSPDGQHVAFGSMYKEVCLINLKGDVVQRIPSEARLESLEFMPRNSMLLVPNRRPKPGFPNLGYVQLWNADLSQLEGEFDRPRPQNSGFTIAKSSPCEQFIAAGRRQKADVLFFQRQSKRFVGETSQFHSILTDLAYSLDGKTLAVGYRNGTIHLFELQPEGDNFSINQRPRAIRAHSGEVFCTRFLSSSKLASCGTDGCVRIWDTLDTSRQSFDNTTDLWAGPHRIPWKTPPPPDGINDIELSTDGSLLLYMRDRRTLVYDVTSGESLHDFAVSVKCGAWSPSGERYAICRINSDKVDVNDRDGKQVFAIFHATPANDVAFSPTDHLIAVIGDRQLQLCSADDGKETFSQTLSVPGLAVGFSHHRRQLAYGGRFEGIVLFDPIQHQVLRELAGGWDTHCLAFSHDDSLLAAGDGDGLIRIWETDTGRQRAELVGHESIICGIAFSPDGHTLISTAQDDTVRLWSVDHNRSFGILVGGANRNYYDCGQSFSDDGRHFAIVYRPQDDTHEVLLWHMSPRSAQ